MIASRKIGILWLGLLTAMLMLLFASAPQASATHAWGNYHWARSANPFTVPLGDNVDPVYDQDLAQASSDWSQSSVLDSPVTAGSGCALVAGTGQVCNGAYGNTTWVGLATISLDAGGHILAGKAQMNDTYLLQDSGGRVNYNTPYFRDFVMCQEVGHIYGLDHQDENFYNRNLGTCMDYTARPQGGRRWGSLANLQPNAHDYEQLELIYAHLDSRNAGNSEGVLHQVDGTDPQERGKLVSETAASKTFVRTFDDGSAVVTVIDLLPDGDIEE